MKEIINVTEIIEYLYCPRKVYLKRIKKIKPPVTKAMILGFLKHKVFDIFNKNEILMISAIKTNIDKEQIKQNYHFYLKRVIKEVIIQYSNLISKFDISPDNLTNQIFNFLEKDIDMRAESIKGTLNLGFFGKELWRNLKPKYLTEYQIVSQELGLKGRIDRIKFEQEILPYEIKTRQGIYDSDKLQLAAYSLLLEEEFKKEIKKGIIEAGKGHEEIDITQEMKQKILEIADKVRKIKDPGFHNNFNKCKS